MSADAPFVERATERFSLQSSGQRAVTGRVFLGLLLDPSTPQIPPADTPGALHLAPRKTPLPYRLIHAKVALLGFADEESGTWCVRLIVSTGNWTRQTLDRSLDLSWSIDLHRDHPPGPPRSQAVADICAGRAFLSRLREQYDDSALTQTVGAQALATRNHIDALDAWIDDLPVPSGVQPRFLHNETEPLLATVPRAARHFGGPTKRNYIVLGSGFYGSAPADGLPSVPARLVAALRASKAPLLTSQPEVDLVVNPIACQGVAAAAPAIRAARGWRAIAAVDPHGDTGGLRSLHAKFVLCANWRDGGSATSPWLYLGSGNLTEAGFTLAASQGGNLEAGVVFVPEVVRWRDIGKLLPFDWNSADLASLPQGLAAGPPAPERALAFAAPPFAFLTHDGEEGLLRPNKPCLTASLVWPGGVRAPAIPDGAYAFVGPPLRQVEVAWVKDDMELRAFVPVVDREGRVAGVVRGPLTFEGLPEELGSFPDQPQVDGGSDDSSGDESIVGQGNTANGEAHASIAPLRDLMHAIELVAQHQTRIPEGQWDAWIARLEQALVRMKDQPMVFATRELGVNPLAVLRLPAFRPAHCERDDGLAATSYEAALDRIERAWAVNGLLPLGGEAT
jgi:hypothetical protein